MNDIKLPILFKDYPNGCKPKGQLCSKKCRLKGQRGDKWRQQQTGNKQFVCPFGLGMGWKQLVKEQPKVQPAPVTVKNIVSALKVIMVNGKVTEEIAKERMDTCKGCKYYKQKGQNFFCGVPGACNCTIGGRHLNSILKINSLDLVLYNETTDKKLCLHPKRKDGEGWKR